MPQQVIRFDDNGQPITQVSAPKSLEVDLTKGLTPPKALTPETEEAALTSIAKIGLKAVPQIALAFLTRGMTIPAQAGIQGGAGVIRAKLEGRADPLMAGAEDAAMTGVTSGIANVFKPVRMLQNAAGPEAKMTEATAKDLLEAGAGRLVPSNTQAMRTAADKVRTSIPNLPRGAGGKIIVGPRSVPGPSPLDPAVTAHELGVKNAAKVSPAVSQSEIGAIARMVTNPVVRSAAAQGIYSIAGNNPAGLSNAIRIAVLELLRGNK